MELIDHLQDRGLYIGHLNIRSIFPKIDILQHIVTGVSEKIGILGISETWLQPQMPDEFVELANYKLVRNDRVWNNNPNSIHPKKGGGVCLYIRDNIDFDSEKYKPFNRSSKDIEMQWVILPHHFSKDTLIINAYRPPSGDIAKFFRNH